MYATIVFYVGRTLMYKGEDCGLMSKTVSKEAFDEAFDWTYLIELGGGEKNASVRIFFHQNEE